MNILLAVDGSRCTRRMLAYLAAHDEWLGARHRYAVLHAVPAIPPNAASFLHREQLQGYYRDEAEKVFRPVRAFFRQQGIEAEFVAQVGPAAKAIARQAGGGAFDLLVMGSHGKGGVAKLAMGSVATQVLANCRLPVLLVR